MARKKFYGMDWSRWPSALTKEEAEQVRDQLLGPGVFPEVRHPWYGSSEPDRGYMVRLWNWQTKREAYVQSLDGIEDAIEELGPFDPERKPAYSRRWWC
jgi:hypothetical protein